MGGKMRLSPLNHNLQWGQLVTKIKILPTPFEAQLKNPNEKSFKKA